MVLGLVFCGSLCDLIVFWNFGICEDLGSESLSGRMAVESMSCLVVAAEECMDEIALQRVGRWLRIYLGTLVPL